MLDSDRVDVRNTPSVAVLYRNEVSVHNCFLSNVEIWLKYDMTGLTTAIPDFRVKKRLKLLLNLFGTSWEDQAIIIDVIYRRIESHRLTSLPDSPAWPPGLAALAGATFMMEENHRLTPADRFHLNRIDSYYISDRSFVNKIFLIEYLNTIIREFIFPSCMRRIVQSPSA